MFNLLVSFLIVISSFEFFHFSYSINGINRLVLNTPIEFFNAAIPLVNDEEEIFLYFQQDILENNLNVYYSTLHRYSQKYEVNYYYYNLEDESICLSRLCQGVEIRVRCDIFLGFEYKRTMFYEIGERA